MFISNKKLQISCFRVLLRQITHFSYKKSC